jgi:hypothetical protein
MEVKGLPASRQRLMSAHIVDGHGASLAKDRAFLLTASLVMLAASSPFGVGKQAWTLPP